MAKNKRQASKRKYAQYPFGIDISALPNTKKVGVQGMVDFSRSTAKQVEAACSCLGVNEKCFKCAGTGTYDKVVAETVSAAPALLGPKAPIMSFVADSRGGNFGIREQGRFCSSPDYDDHSEESHAE